MLLFIPLSLNIDDFFGVIYMLRLAFFILLGQCADRCVCQGVYVNVSGGKKSGL